MLPLLPPPSALVLSLNPRIPRAQMLVLENLTYRFVRPNVLDIKLGTVRSRIHRGRSQLREALAHRAPEVRAAAASSGTRRPGVLAPAGGAV